MSDEKFLRKINGVLIDPSDIHRLLEKIDDTEPERRCFETAIGAIATLFREKSADYRVALMFRMEALSKIIQEGNGLIAGYVIKGPKTGQSLISEYGIAAACNCELICTDGKDVRFDRAEFIHEALLAAEPEGEA